MDILKFRVRGQALTLTNPNIKLIPVTDTVNQYLCQFEFSEDWDDLNKVVVFKNVSYNITKEVYLSTSNECYIPWEVLSNAGEIFLEVIGTEVRGEVVTVRIPSTLLGFKWEVQEGLLDVSANISPTPDLFEQFVSSVRSDSIVAATARDEAVIARDVAVQSAADASASELAATSAAESAVNSASTASSAASSASESALSVAGVADETKSYAEIASAKAADASTQAEIAAGAKEDAVIAKAGAEAARDEAATSADLAQTTESHIKTMTVSAHSLAETEAPTVTKTDTSTGFALDFGIPKGATGPKGEDGDNIHYTWVKYADTPTSGMSDDPTGKEYIGIAYNKSTSVGSTVYSDYAWSRIKGEAGEDGYSPTVTTGIASDGSTTLTVTNKDGSTTTELVDGKARADIDNLEIGGRNLVLFSRNFNRRELIYGASGAVRGLEVVEYDDRTAIKYTGENTGAIMGGYLLTPYTVTIEEGVIVSSDVDYNNFIISFDYKCESSLQTNNFQLRLFSYDGTTGAYTNAGRLINTSFTSNAQLTPTSNWKRVEIGLLNIIRPLALYGTGEALTGTFVIGLGYVNNPGAAFEISKIKFERGNKATDWTPAPEDIGLLTDRSFWLVGGIRIPSSSDLNDYKTVGNYYSAGSAVSATLSNTPITNDAFMLKVLNGYSSNDTNSILLQKIVNSYDGIEYIRSYSGGAWKPWRSVETRRLLWTNASPTSSFAAQTVSLSLSGYNFVEIHCRNNASYNVCTVFTSEIVKDLSMQIITDVQNANAIYVADRRAAISSNGITFESAYYKSVASTAVGTIKNDRMVPYKIYGIKGV